MTVGFHYYKGMIVGLAIQSLMAPFNIMENPLVKAVFTGLLSKEDVTFNSKIFKEKHEADLVAGDEIVDETGQVIVISKPEDKSKANKKEIVSAASSKSLEEILLDTWDAGSEADVTPLLQALTKDNVNFKTSESGWTPLMIVSAMNSKDTAIAMEKLRSLQVDIAITDEEGWNALHWAAYHGSAAGAKFLVSEEGFDGIQLGLHLVKDKEGKDAIHHARTEGNNDVLAVIEAAISNHGEKDEKSGGLSAQDGMRKRK
jgi:ankyrin repeat protein